MGLGASTPQCYEGYGRTDEEAVAALECAVRYHHEDASSRIMRCPPSLGSYYIWDGTRQLPVYFTIAPHGIFRAYIQQ